MTTFGDGVFQYGGMPVGGGMLPLMGGPGKVYFVDPANGSDGNTGRSPERALDTVGAAYLKTVDKSGDTIYLLNDGNTSGSSREATLPITWGKDNVHLVGLCAPTFISQRSRITPVSGDALTAAPVIDVTGNGNVFMNMQIAHFGADTDSIATRGMDVSGSRNYFHNLHIVGIVNDHTGDDSSAADLLVDGGAENLWRNCTFGIDSVVRSVANATIDFTSQAVRNVFENCLFSMKADASTPLFLKADSSGDLDRYILFRDSTFINVVKSGSTTIDQVANIGSTATGIFVFQNCSAVGVTNIAASDNAMIWVDGVGGASTGSLGIVATR